MIEIEIDIKDESSHEATEFGIGDFFMDGDGDVFLRTESGAIGFISGELEFFDTDDLGLNDCFNSCVDVIVDMKISMKVTR